MSPFAGQWITGSHPLNADQTSTPNIMAVPGPLCAGFVKKPLLRVQIVYFFLPEPQSLPPLNGLLLVFFFSLFFCISAIKGTKSFLEIISFLRYHKEVSSVGWVVPSSCPTAEWRGMKRDFVYSVKHSSGTWCSTRYPPALAILFCRFSPWGNIQTLQV